jgi:APA family basic amino acid/polyamine antiporter
MAEDGLFLHSVAQIHTRFGTPAKAILVQGLISSVLVLVSSFQQIIAYFIFVAIVFLALAGAGLTTARRRGAGRNPRFSMPMYPVPLIVFLGLMTLLLLLLMAHSPREAVFGAAVVLAGVPVYSAFRRNGSGPVFSRKPIVEEVNSQP